MVTDQVNLIYPLLAKQIYTCILENFTFSISKNDSLFGLVGLRIGR